jgi:hypothetical protein
VGSGRHELMEDDGTAGLGMARVDGVAGLGRTTLSQAQKRCSRLGDGACVVDGITDLGWTRWRCVRAWTMVGNDGMEAPGILNNGMGSDKVDDGAGSREIFGRKFWQHDDESERLQGLGFTKTMQRFIYRGTTIATGINDAIRAVATENHSSDGRLPSSARC